MAVGLSAEVELSDPFSFSVRFRRIKMGLFLGDSELSSDSAGSLEASFFVSSAEAVVAEAGDSLADPFLAEATGSPACLGLASLVDLGRLVGCGLADRDGADLLSPDRIS